MFAVVLALSSAVAIPGCIEEVCLETREDGRLLIENQTIETRTAMVRLLPSCAPEYSPEFLVLEPKAQTVITANSSCTDARLNHSRGVPQTDLHDVRYQIPIARGYHYEVTQSPQNRTSHARWEANAVDFAAPIGTPIVAARGGYVIDVYDESTSRCRRPTKACFDQANYLVIQHDDGSVAYYVHLAPGSARVALGDQVRQGSIVANIGLTGFTSGPHLHFDVVALGPRLERVSIAVAFDAY